MKKIHKLFTLILIGIIFFSSISLPTIVYADEEFDVPNELDGVKVGYYATWEAPMDWMLNNNAGTKDRQQLMAWAATNGHYDDKGFWRVGKYYFVAVAPAFCGPDNHHGAMIGDHITFKMSDGSSLECIVIDTKGSTKGTDMHGKKFDYLDGTPLSECFEFHDPQGEGRENRICGYGHAPKGHDINVLEFTGIVDGQPYNKLGYTNGTYVKSFSNHKTAKEFKSSSYYIDSLFNDSVRPYGEKGVNRTGRPFGDTVEKILRKLGISPVSNVQITDGSLPFTTDIENENRRNLNLEIYNTITEGVSTSSSNQYSLYDRFGPKLQFVQYYGEDTSEVKLFDHIVHSYLQHEDVSIKEDILNYASTTYMSNSVYAKRPKVLSSEMVASGYEDPRVTLYNQSNIGQGVLLFHANVLLTVSSVTVNFMNKLLNNEFQNYAYSKIMELAEQNTLTEIGTTFFAAIGFILFIVIIFSIIKHTFTFLKGKGTLGQIITRILLCVISLGFMFMVIYNPGTTIKWGHTIINFTDEIFKDGLKEMSFKQDDEVVSSSSTDNILEAYMWKTALFEPWCEGTFGTEYKNLYTQFDTDTTHKKMSQSYIADHNSMPDSGTNVYYDSATLTGDVVVDVGHGKQVRNWAAFLYSSLSTYHIDATAYIDKLTVEEETPAYSALKTADNSYHADLFRVIDAKMNISPEYMKDDGKEVTVDTYTNSNQYETHYYEAGWDMMWRALLMLMLLPIVVLKISAYFRVLFNFFKGIYYGMVEILKENQGLSDWWTNFKKAIVDYFYRSIQLYILITLYITLVQKDNILFTIMFVVLTLVVTAITPKDIRRGVLTTKRNLQRWF